MDVYEIRRKNLRYFANLVGGVPMLARKWDKSETRIRHLIGRNPVRNIGERAARDIERLFDKPHGWMDFPHSELWNEPVGKAPIHPEEPPTQPEFEPTLKASENIRQQIEAGIQRGLTPRDIAESTGVSKQTVSQWRRTGSVSIENLPKLARVLGISLEQLLTGAPVQGRIPSYAYRHLKDIEEKATKGQLTKRDIKLLAQLADVLAEKGKK